MLKTIYAGSGLKVVGGLFQVLGCIDDNFCISNFDLRKGNFDFLLQEQVVTP